MKSKKDITTIKVGTKILVERTKRKLTQEQLADLAKISRGALGTIERGEKSPSISTLSSIANALNIDLYKLFIFED